MSLHKNTLNTQNNLSVHKIILANQKKVVVNGRHWLTQKILCVLKGICAIFFDWSKLCGVHKGFQLCVDIGFSV